MLTKWVFECSGRVKELTEDMEAFEDLHELKRGPLHFVECNECSNVTVLHLLERSQDG